MARDYRRTLRAVPATRRLSLRHDLDAPAQMTSDGVLINPCHVRLISKSWRPLLRRICTSYIDWFGDRVVSIYLRGSIARGTAVEGHSDVDTCAIVRGRVTLIDQDACWVMAQDIDRRYAVCSGVELVAYNATRLRRDPAFESMRFLLKTFAICIKGDDVLRNLSPYSADEIPHVTLPGLADSLNVGIDILSKDHSLGVTRDLCRWLAKQMIRAAYDLCLPQIQCYSRDLLPCARTVAMQFPVWRKSIFQLLELAIRPTFDDRRLRKAILGIGQEIVARAEKTESK